MSHHNSSDSADPGELPLGEKAPKPFTEGLPHTLGPHLPVPCKVPSWPYQNIGAWKNDVPSLAQSWRAAFKIWKREHLIRLGYNDLQYRREDLKWSQRNFVHVLMMVEDRYFYDSVQRKYTVDKYLDDLARRYGGVDSVLIWYVYPNIGIDDRNQTELASDLPGGIAGLRQVVADFHRRGVKVFLPTMPWDHGTNDSRKSDSLSVIELAKMVNADGVNGDTYSGMPQSFREASDRLDHSLVLQPESNVQLREALIWNNQSWGKAVPEMKDVIPVVSKLKWLEPRHMMNMENRWCRNRKDDLHYIFFNGIGYNAWENVWGIWNQFTERDAATLKRISAIYRQFPELMVSLDWEPYAHTLQNGVFASGFPGPESALWTIVNRNEFDLDGDQLTVAHQDGTSYYDLWRGVPLKARIRNGQAILALALETYGFGAVLAVRKGAALSGLDGFLKKMAGPACVPLQSLSSTWTPSQQRLVEVAPTKVAESAPQGMLAIPAAEFDFVVHGVEIEGFTAAGTGFQYPWESAARRHHRHTLSIGAFYIDCTPVTNTQFQQFVDATQYRPADEHHFLKDWVNGAPRAGWENQPVTWVALEDARAYCVWAGKRLPREWEWQYAAQGTDGRLYPWGNSWDPKRVPPANQGRNILPPADVDAHPLGASPFGVLDMVGNVWQWTDEFVDEHTRSAALRGGSSYQPQSSHWYFPQTYRLDQHGKYLLMAPSKDRSGCLGFRCVVDA
ncbi:MAG: formylglycine-generating enzyme family protein [Rhodocyclaceae bacterium]|nr:MAG: formylglycine-generating enzyme family protein [Rhodocyclaceae bacterium]